MAAAAASPPHRCSRLLFLVCWCFAASLLLSLLPTSQSADTISTNQTLSDGDTIVSAGGVFELGFFTPGNPSNSTTNRYLGIWYKNISTFTVVWVANRESPVADNTGYLWLNRNGTLTLRSRSYINIWSSNSSGSAGNPVARILDSGNFVIGNENDQGIYIWQSFDYPSDTLLPGMKFGKDLVTGLERRLTPWKSAGDPSPGDFTALIETTGYPQFIVVNGSVVQFRPGPWNGFRFSGQLAPQPNMHYNPDFVMNQREIYYRYFGNSNSNILRNVITPSGNIVSYRIDPTEGTWHDFETAYTDRCDSYGLCGSYGSCEINNNPVCGCLKGFEPTSPQQWDVADWSGGCKRRVDLDCGSGEGFIKYSGLKLPDTKSSWFNTDMTLEQCEKRCKSNCSCTAYSTLDVSGTGSGCLLWFGGLIDIRSLERYGYVNGQDIYVRMARSSSRNKLVMAIVIAAAAVVIFIGLGLFYLSKRRRRWQHRHIHRDKQGPREQDLRHGYNIQSQNGDIELPFFSLSMLLKATSNFSINNKLGEGGFGPVYKGMLEEGQEIAVKRLSKTSKQGLDEFKNEVICIAKLQHRNLVKLLGCCTEGDEMMLIYEYMPNRSLDCFIFDESQGNRLDWPTRYHIINGIARGLTYLHQDSRLRIVHRDLKAGNILLDSDMNPKISDFGLARRFGGVETGANTNNVVGTYGYISPEYAVNGLYSVKSDVFSFGVIVLEIVSGKKNRVFSHGDHHDNLLAHAWRLYKEGRSLELVDEALGNSYAVSEVLRSIHVGLLCVQQRAEDRPSMSSVVMMLGSEATLPPPNQPGFFIESSIVGAECNQSMPLPVSINEVTLTLIKGR